MPLPTPNRDESQNDFVGRCIEEVAEEFDDQDQRIAVCESQWHDRNTAMNQIKIYGEIGGYLGIAAEWIMDRLAEIEDKDPILIRINSPGGGFDQGPAIVNALKSHKGPITTQVDGIAYSMAAVILQAGDIRQMPENAVLMVHGGQSFAEGAAEDMRQTADMIDTHNRAMISAFTDKGIDQEIAEEWVMSGKDFFFDAKEALDADLIDKIIPSVDLGAVYRYMPKAKKIPQRIVAQYGAFKMPDDKKPEQSGKIDVSSFSATRTQNIREGEKRGAKAEKDRQDAIRAFFDRPHFADPERIGEENVRAFRDLCAQCLSDMAVMPDQAREAALDLQDQQTLPLVQTSAPQASGSSYAAVPVMPPKRPQQGAIVPGQDAAEKYIQGVTKALEIKANLITEQAELRKQSAENEFMAMSPYEMARHYLEMHRIPLKGVRRTDIIGQALVSAAGIAHSSSDFANILENIANKAMMAGWDETPETWNQWARTGTLPDFKQGSRVNLSTFGDLDIIHENGEYKYGTFSDLKETLQLATYGKLFGISRQALANDDLSALSNIPRGMGRAAARKIGDLAYNVLTSNPTLNQDSTPVFDATHNNIGTPGPVSVAPGGSIDELWTAMGLQKDPAGSTLNITPSYLIVPRAIQVSSETAIADKTFADTAAAQERMNPFQNRLMVVSDARLDEVSATAWYMLANGNMFDTVEVAFLNGQQTPYLESKEGWQVDGVEYKVRIDAVAVALDFRTMAYNAGA